MPEDAFVATMREWMEFSMRHSMRNLLRYARQSGLSMSHLGAIFHVHRIGSSAVTEIGEQLGVTCAAASQMLDRLVELGLVARSEDPLDRRVRRIELTEKGQAELKQAIAARASWVEDLGGALSDDEKQTIVTALKTMMARIRQFNPDAALPQ